MIHKFKSYQGHAIVIDDEAHTIECDGITSVTQEELVCEGVIRRIAYFPRCAWLAIKYLDNDDFIEAPVMVFEVPSQPDPWA